MVWTCDEESGEDWVKKCMEFTVEGRCLKKDMVRE